MSFSIRKIFPILITLLLTGCGTRNSSAPTLKQQADELQQSVDELGRSIRELRCAIDLNDVPAPKLQKMICNYLGRPDRCARPTSKEIREAIDGLVKRCADGRGLAKKLSRRS